jgi:hypothetical protein
MYRFTKNKPVSSFIISGTIVWKNQLKPSTVVSELDFIFFPVWSKCSNPNNKVTSPFYTYHIKKWAFPGGIIFCEREKYKLSRERGSGYLNQLWYATEKTSLTNGGVLAFSLGKLVKEGTLIFSWFCREFKVWSQL